MIDNQDRVCSGKTYDNQFNKHRFNGMQTHSNFNSNFKQRNNWDKIGNSKNKKNINSQNSESSEFLNGPRQSPTKPKSKDL